MISVTDFGFDANVFYFGKICIHGHEHLETGFCLRYKKKWACVQCKKATDKDFRTVNEVEVKKRKKEYYENVKYEDWYKVSQKQKREVFYSQNKERLNEQARSQYAENRDYYQKRNREWKKNNPEKVKASARQDNLNHRERKNLNLIRYRARKRNANHVSYTKADIKALLVKTNHQCVYCGYEFEANQKRVRQLDHFIPLSLGGFDTITNLVPACISCNSAKRDRIPHKWYEGQPFYSKERWDYILRTLDISEPIYEIIADTLRLRSTANS